MRQFGEYLEMVQARLIPALSGIGSIPEPLLEAMRYSLDAGGKRIRPVLLLAACELAGGRAAEAVPYACALEMIHTYSLIHDDLPAMDNDDLRRGKPTNHKMFGEARAILAGDGLLNAAAEIMSADAAGRPDALGVRAMASIMRHAGVTGMIAGQTADLEAEGKAPGAGTLLYIHAHKTADLLQAPMEAGLILAGAGEEQIRAGSDYGYHFGLAFQMTDDLLDVTGSAETLGKNTGMDAALHKMTWVALKGVDGTRADAEREVREAVAAIERIGGDTRFFRELAEGLLTRNN